MVERIKAGRGLSELDEDAIDLNTKSNSMREDGKSSQERHFLMFAM